MFKYIFAGLFVPSLSCRGPVTVNFRPTRYLHLAPRPMDMFMQEGLQDVPIHLLSLTWRREERGKDQYNPIFEKLTKGIEDEEKVGVNRRKTYTNDAPCKEVMNHMPPEFFDTVGVNKKSFIDIMVREAPKFRAGVSASWKQLLMNAEASRINGLTVADPCIHYLAWACFTIRDPPTLNAARDLNLDTNYVLSTIVGMISKLADSTPNYNSQIREMHHVEVLNNRAEAPLYDLTLFYMRDPGYPKYFFLLYRAKIERLLYGIGSGQIFLLEGASGIGKKTMIYRMAELLANPTLMSDLDIRHSTRFNNHRILQLNKKIFDSDAGFVNQVLYAHKANGSSLFLDLDELKGQLNNGNVIARLMQVLKFGSTVYITSSGGEMAELKKYIKLPMVEISVQSPSVEDLIGLCQQWTLEMSANNCVTFDDRFCKKAAELSDSYKTSPNPAYLIKLLNLTLESRTIPADIPMPVYYKVCEVEYMKRQLSQIATAISINDARLDDAPLANESNLIETLDFYYRMILSRGAMDTSAKLSTSHNEWEARMATLLRSQGQRLDNTTAEYRDIVEAMYIAADAVSTPLSLLTEFSVDVFTADKKDLLSGLFVRMEAQVKNQDQALKTIIDHLSMTMTSDNANQPHSGALFLYGPTGVGKTQTVKVLAECLGKHYIAFAMNEYMAETAASTLLGADQGYLGHGKWGTLGTALVGHTSAVLFFDEFDKAHKSIRPLLLGVLEEGEVWSKDSSIKEPLRLTHTIIFFASNFFGQEISEVAFRRPEDQEAGYQEIDNKIKGELQKQFGFRPEFMNRIDRFVRYDPITRERIKPVLPIVLSAALNRYPRWTMKINVSVINFLIAYFFNSQEGVRGLKKNVAQIIAAKITAVQRYLKANIPEDMPNEEHLLEVYINHGEVEKDKIWNQARIQLCANLNDASSNAEKATILPNSSSMEKLYSRYARYHYKSKVYTHMSDQDVSTIVLLGDFNDVGYENNPCKFQAAEKPTQDEINIKAEIWSDSNNRALDDTEEWKQNIVWEDNVFIDGDGKVRVEATSLKKAPKAKKGKGKKTPSDGGETSNVNVS